MLTHFFFYLSLVFPFTISAATNVDSYNLVYTLCTQQLILPPRQRFALSQVNKVQIFDLSLSPHPAHSRINNGPSAFPIKSKPQLKSDLPSILKCFYYGAPTLSIPICFLHPIIALCFQGHFAYPMMFLLSWPTVPSQMHQSGLSETFFPNLTPIPLR